MNDFDSSFIYNDDFIEENDLFHPSDDFDFPMSDTPPDRITFEPTETPRARIFVKIPNNFMEPEDADFSHCHSQNSRNEIKSEPIKFELSENHTSADENAAQTSRIESLPDDAPNLITARPKNGVKCLRCSECLFATIFEDRLDEHRRTSHIHPEDGSSRSEQSNKNTRKCPACGNEFLARKSLETHLELDHEMPVHEIQSLIDERHVSQQEGGEQAEPRTNRIYIKSVDVLREPETIIPTMEDMTPLTNSLSLSDSIQNDPIFIDLVNSDNQGQIVLPPFEELQNDVFNDSIHDANNPDDKFLLEISSNNEKPKPKIYIKNVDILKEPLLVPPIQTLPTRILNVNDHFELFTFNDDPETSLDVYESKSTTDQTDLFKANRPVTDEQPMDVEAQNKRLNAIHLRTVDELNLMNMNDVHNFQGNVYTGTIQQESSDFDNPDDTSQMNPSNVPRAKPKIYIKNVDILKEHIVVPPLPAYPARILNVNDNLEFFRFSDDHSTLLDICEPKSTCDKIYLLDSNPVSSDVPMVIEEENKRPNAIHLRTVDELNLMNMDEVQSLQDNAIGNQLLQVSNDLVNLSCHTNGKAKIYIKNVDILKEPILVPPISAPARILNVHDNLNLDIFSHNDDQSPPLDMYEPKTTPDETDLLVSCYSASADATTDPEVQNKRPNAIHLRTVDELNLLNMNEVQNLLSSLPEDHSNEDQIRNPMTVIPSSENSKNSDDIRPLNSSTPFSIPGFIYNQDNNFNVDESDLVSTNWSNFDSLENGENSLKPNAELTQLSTYFDLNTPHQILLDKSDQDLLAAYARNLIDDSQECLSPEKVENYVDIEMAELRLGEIVEIEDDVEHLGKQNSQSDPSKATANNVAHTPEKGRIYVANNLMADRSDTVQEQLQSAPRSRGRESGSRKVGITKMKKSNPAITYEELGFFKCDLGCAYTFRDPSKLEYHKKCHTSSPLKMQCIECNQNDFCSWNTLHTHLWRRHQIDMELYSCDQCSFKTPILSRLINTHSKLHSDERNFKCDECEMAFKNARQLKDHRRKHRLPAKEQDVLLCQLCNSAFGSQKTLNVHLKSKHTDRVNEVADSPPRFQCDKCEYNAKDHNAFRKHKMIHDNGNKYQCQFCDFSCIQSTVYQKHVRQKHPDRSSEVILQCSQCRFSTINRRYYEVHIAKHRNILTSDVNIISCDNVQEPSITSAADQNPQSSLMLSSSLGADTACQTDEFSHAIIDNDNDLEILNLDTVDNRQKIKVKSVSVLTDPRKFCNLERIPIPDWDIYNIL